MIKKTIPLILLLSFFICSVKINAQTIPSKQNAKMKTDQQVFIDKFFVPQNSKQEFVERMNINRNFIKGLPGFIEDNVYERTDEQGNFIVVTVAVWQNEEAIKKAKEAVQAEYKRTNFNMPEMLKRLDITIDRGVYKRVED